MVSLVIKNPDLPSGYNVVSTTWQLATSKDFVPSSIIQQSLENTVNKFNIQFDIELELGVKYYARCRVVYNKGFSNYSNINVFIAKDLNEIELNLSLIDIIELDLTRPYYIKKEGQYYILNKITFQKGQTTIGEFIRINK